MAFVIYNAGALKRDVSCKLLNRSDRDLPTTYVQVGATTFVAGASKMFILSCKLLNRFDYVRLHFDRRCLHLKHRRRVPTNIAIDELAVSH